MTDEARPSTNRKETSKAGRLHTLNGNKGEYDLKCPKSATYFSCYHHMRAWNFVISFVLVVIAIKNGIRCVSSTLNKKVDIGPVS